MPEKAKNEPSLFGRPISKLGDMFDTDFSTRSSGNREYFIMECPAF
jgi:hypothetical protein